MIDKPAYNRLRSIARIVRFGLTAVLFPRARTKSQKSYQAFFDLGLRAPRGSFLAYQPDSHANFEAHPEFEELLPRFTAFNRANNGGDLVRLWSFILNIKQALADGIHGDFAELGVWRGNTSAVLAKCAPSDRNVFLFDTYAGFDARDLNDGDADKHVRFADTSLDLVKQVVGDAANCHYVKGYFPDSVLSQHRAATYAVVSLDVDLYLPTKAGLEFFYPRMPKGGIFFLHDYSNPHWDGPKKAIDEFCVQTGERVILLADKSGSAILRKAH